MSATAATPAPVAPLLVDCNEVAAMVNASPRTVYRWEEQGLMPKRRKLGSLVRWSRAEVEKWVADGCPPRE